MIVEIRKANASFFCLSRYSVIGLARTSPPVTVAEITNVVSMTNGPMKGRLSGAHTENKSANMVMYAMTPAA